MLLAWAIRSPADTDATTQAYVVQPALSDPGAHRVDAQPQCLSSFRTVNGLAILDHSFVDNLTSSFPFAHDTVLFDAVNLHFFDDERLCVCFLQFRVNPSGGASRPCLLGRDIDDSSFGRDNVRVFPDFFAGLHLKSYGFL